MGIVLYIVFGQPGNQRWINQVVYFRISLSRVCAKISRSEKNAKDIHRLPVSGLLLLSFDIFLAFRFVSSNTGKCTNDVQTIKT